MARAATRQQTDPDAAAMLAALDALRVAVTIFDAQGRLLHANAHLNHLLLSLPPHQGLIGRSYEEIVRLEIAGGEIAPAALAQGVPAFVARRLAQLKDGAWAPLDVPLADRRVMEIKARRTQDGITVLLWTDVTAARTQMAQLEEVVSLSADAFAFFDRHDRLVMGNALYAQLCGVTRLDALMGQTFVQIVTTVAHSGRLALDEPPQAWLDRRLKGHRQPAGAITLKISSGECYLVRDRGTPDGGRVLVFTDITDKVRAETALAEQQDALAQASAREEAQSSYLAALTSRLDQVSAKVDSAKTTLLRTMGHELKTPLNAILGFSELLMNMAPDLTPAQVREYAELVNQGGNNLLKIINQIMDLTKISAGRYELRRTLLDAGSLLWQAREAFAAEARARNVTILANDCPVGLLVLADEPVLTVMVQSLVDNAVSFTRTGGTVTLTAQKEDGFVCLAVCDDGPGVAPDDLVRILQPFEHAGSGEGAQHAKGAGLGLTLVKAFAELHGGRLELHSAPGKGFTASILLPAP